MKIVHIIKPYKKLYIISSGISVVLVFAQLMQARLTQALIDHISVGMMGKFALTVLGFFGIIGVTVLLNYLRQNLVADMSSGAVRDLKCKVSEALLHADYFTLNMESSGNAMAAINQDMRTVGNFLQKDLTELFAQFSMAIGTFLYMLCLKPELALITFLYLPVGVWIMFCINKKMKPFFTVMAEESGKSLSVVEQVLSQIPVIKSFRMEKKTRERIYHSYEQVWHAEKKVVTWGILMPFFGTAALQIPRITYFGFGGYLVLQGAFSIGAFISMLDLLSFIIQPVTSLPWLVQGFNETMASLKRVQRLLELPSGEMPRASSGDNPAIEIREMTFGYDKETPLFHEFSFQQQEPGITVLCGASGCGKTTLLDLISGLYRPDSGSVTVTGEISVVTQETFLFADSLLENVRIARPEASEEEVTDALKRAGAYAFATELPQGIHTLLGDGNQTLSGGQRQRIGLARTILQNHPIWLLDEPTSALDEETEQTILDVIKGQREKKIILISAHRPSLIALADRKVVL